MKMADEDEIDVLGDFSLDNLLSKNTTGISCYDSSQNTELLSDYTLNSPWLLENPVSNSDCWYTTADDGNATNTSLGFDEVICTEHKSSDEWTEDEKLSLSKGLEIFGKHCNSLAQFIGSKSPGQVRYYLKHHYNKNATVISSNFNNLYNMLDVTNKNNASISTTDLPSVFQMSDIIEDSQIPASIEEVIAVVSTARPTVQSITKKPCTKKKQYKNISSKKFKFSSHLPRGQQSQLKFPAKRKKIREKTINHDKGSVTDLNKIKHVAPVQYHPVSTGEEIVKIQKEECSESDAEIDVDVDVDELKPVKGTILIKDDSEKISAILKEETAVKQNYIKDVKIEEAITLVTASSNNEDECLKRQLESVDEPVFKFLTSCETPTSEYYLEDNIITEAEKFIHSEFFKGRPTKTPSRYLKIRNSILDFWLENKPQYCTKTAVRRVLKNCGDVNCIGRIHQYLEQIGAINFGCEQTTYIRPLFNITSVASQPKEKNVATILHKNEVSRPRMKKKFYNDGEGGYTLMHDENGKIIDTNVVNEDKQSKPRTHRRQNIKLVYCKMFTDENPAPYEVNIHLSALLLIDIHAHSALIEVMGLLGGYFDRENNILHITRYIPCKGLDHSNTHCDMCPVSQSEASEALHEAGVEVIGWFHSHPTFYPNPSVQDIDTQLSMQTYLSNKYKPFVGVILSPFRALATALVSEYRCLIVDKDNNIEDVGIPFKFQTNLNSQSLNVQQFLDQAVDIFTAENNIPKEYKIDFEKPYFHDTSITYLEKLLASVKLHLARCSEINKMTCDTIVHGITEICLRSRSIEEEL